MKSEIRLRPVLALRCGCLAIQSFMSCKPSFDLVRSSFNSTLAFSAKSGGRALTDIGLNIHRRIALDNLATITRD